MSGELIGKPEPSWKPQPLGGFMSQRVLVIAPHMDDEALGCGGVIVKHATRGDIVDVCFVANRAYGGVTDESQEGDATAAQAVLGYHASTFVRLPDENVTEISAIKALEEVVEEVDPTIVYVNHGGDNHQDHRAVFDAAMVVLRQSAVPSVRKILSYETPSSTDQASPTSQPFRPTSYHDISHLLDRKLQAIGCYRKELRPFPHPRSIEAVRALATLRGSQSGFSAAEAFMVIRERCL